MAVTGTMESHVQWMAPAPLWADLASAADPPTRATVRRPAVLRFDSDSFMEETITLLNHQPWRLGEYRAVPETWQAPATTPAPTAVLPPAAAMLPPRGRPVGNLARLAAPAGTPAGVAGPLKLYQPAHQRFYLVGGCLVCRIPGLPDRVLDIPNQERVSYVVRRLRLPSGSNATTVDLSTADEHAFVTTDGSPGWQKVADAGANAGAVLAPGEELLPLFPLTYRAEDGRKRRLFAGLVPVGRRDAYLGAAARGTPAAGLAAPPDPRITLFQSQVTGPWNAVVAQAEATANQISASQHSTSTQQPPFDPKPVLATARDQIQTVSWYVLLDFARYLAQYLPHVWAALQPNQQATLTPAEQALVAALQQVVAPADGRALPSALAAILPFADDLDRITHPYTYWEDLANGTTSAAPTPPSWPTFRFPLADPDTTVPYPGNNDSQLSALVQAALPAQVPAHTPPLPLAAQPPLDANDPGWFIIRFVFERPACGQLPAPPGNSPASIPFPSSPLALPLLSESSEVFQLAAFFDPDAPARPIRVTLPVDTTPAGLRKFAKNTAFAVSDVLCGQMDALGSLTLGDLVLSVLPFPFHKDLPVSAGGTNGPCTEGMLCSLSIPIITICAMILLMIILKLLDIVFFWMAFFRVCFPLPSFKAKG